MIEIRPASDRTDLRAFIDLPPRIYAGQPGFEPPLRLDRDMLLNPKRSAFWQHGQVQYWLAWRDGKAVGRISAQIDTQLPVGIAHGAGMFGSLDAIDDEAVVRGLIGAAEEWLTARGCTSIFGPCTLDMNDEPGLLVAGADQPAMTLCPWHPPYLGQHLERCGYDRLRDLHNWRLELKDRPPLSSTARRRLAERIPGLTSRTPARHSYAQDIAILCDVYNDGWRHHWGFIPLTPLDLDGLDVLMKWFVAPEAFRIIELEGKPVAVMLLIPNMFELIAGLSPSPGPLGWLRLALRALTHRFRSGRIIVVGLVARLQDTVIGSAIAALMVDELIASQAVLKGEWVEAGWVLENNTALIQILERFKFRRNKTFRIYGKTLGADALLPGQETLS